MRVVLLTAPQPNQQALAHKLTGRVDVVGVVASANTTPMGPGPVRRVRAAVLARTAGRPFTAAWHELQERYARRYDGFPDGCEVAEVEEINNPGTLDLVERLEPDLVMVSGTNLLRAPLISAITARVKIMNLHTGISPYVKGGPNCTNWCLAKGWFDLIGNSVMWIDAGVDSGRLLATERTPLTGDESLLELHWRVMEHAHDLYQRVAVRVAIDGTWPGVSQGEIHQGTTFRNRQWTARAMLSARRNFLDGYAVEIPVMSGRRIELVSLPDL